MPRACARESGFPIFFCHIHIEFLQHLSAQHSTLIFPQSFDDGNRTIMLGSGIQIMGINKNICVNKNSTFHEALLLMM